MQGKNLINNSRIEQRCICINIYLAKLNNLLWIRVELDTWRDAEARKNARISHINRGRTWNRDGTDGGVIVDIFLSWHSPSLFSLLYISLPLFLRDFFLRVTFHLYSLPCLQHASYSIAQLYRSGRGCSDPRRRSSEPWVVATPYLLSRPPSPLYPPFPFIWRTVYIFHRLEILFARSAAKLSRFEIFMNGSLWEGLTHGPSGAAAEQREFQAV